MHYFFSPVGSVPLVFGFVHAAIKSGPLCAREYINSGHIDLPVVLPKVHLFANVCIYILIYMYLYVYARGLIGVSIASSVRFRLKPDTSNSHEFELHRPSNKGTKLLLKVIKAIIIIKRGRQVCIAST